MGGSDPAQAGSYLKYLSALLGLKDEERGRTWRVFKVVALLKVRSMIQKGYRGCSTLRPSDDELAS